MTRLLSYIGLALLICAGTALWADTVPPQVVLTEPTNGETQVSVHAQLRVWFSEPMNASTINETTFIVVGGVSGAVSYNTFEDVASFTPSTQFSYDTTYTAKVSATVTDASGNPMGTDYVWSFSTAADTGVVATCFVATAAYGSPLAGEIRFLRSFRDTVLASTAPGRAFTRWYERTARHAAGLIAGRPVVSAAVRLFLLPPVVFSRIAVSGLFFPLCAVACAGISCCVLAKRRLRV